MFNKLDNIKIDFKTKLDPLLYDKLKENESKYLEEKKVFVIC